MTLEEIAGAVRDDFAEVEPFVLAYVEQTPESTIEPDFVWQHLGKVQKPWRVAVINPGMLSDVLMSAHHVEFGFKQPLVDRKLASCVVSVMAQLLRMRDKNCAIAVLDRHNYGFSVRHQGADDMTIQEIFPADRIH